MPSFCSLFSGSSGNCVHISCAEGEILVDAGVSARRIASALEAVGSGMGRIKAVFLTHEHTDHIRGIPQLAGRYGIPVYSRPRTLEALVALFPELRRAALFAIPEKGAVCAGGFTVSAFSTMHDCADGVGFSITSPEGVKFSVVTDLGRVTREVMAAATGSRLVMLESNHDVGMLMNGRYPYFLKRRIMSEIGHLSNDDCASAAVELVRGGADRLVLAHLSEENNYPPLAHATTKQRLASEGMREGRDFTLETAPRACPGIVYRF